MSVLIRTNFAGRMYVADINRYLEGQQTYEISDRDFAASRILRTMMSRKPPLVTIFRENPKVPQNVVERVIERKPEPADIQKIVESVLSKLDVSQISNQVAAKLTENTTIMPGRAELSREEIREPARTKKSFVKSDSSVVFVESQRDIQSNVKSKETISDASNKDALEKLKNLRKQQ